MKYWYLVVVLFFALNFSVNSAENKLVPYFSNGKWGFADLNHKIIVQPKYDKVDDFIDGRAWVLKNEKCGFIDEAGKEVIPLIYYSAYNFNNAYSVVGNDDKYGVIDTNGNYVIPLSEKYISYFNGEFGKFSIDYIYGLVGKGGNTIVPAEYPKLDEFGKNHFVFSKYIDPANYKLGKMGLMNGKGEIILPAKYDLIYPISNSLATIKDNNLWGLIDTSGKVLIEPVYEEIRNPKPDGCAGFKKDGLWGIVSFDGKVLVEPKYHDLGAGNSFFDEAFSKNDLGFKVTYEGKRGVVDKNGNELIPIKYYMLSFTKNGFTPAYRRLDTNSTGLPKIGLTILDSIGKELFQPNTEWNNVGEFSDGLLSVGSSNSWKSKMIYVDIKGKQVVPGEWEKAEAFNNGLAIVQKSGKVGVIDKKGNAIIPIIFKEIKESDNYPDLFEVSYGYNELFYDKNGKCFCK